MLTNYASITDAIDAATRAAGIIKTGTHLARKAELGKCIYTVQGFAMKATLGDFVDPSERYASEVNTYEKIEELNFAINTLAESVGYQQEYSSDGFGRPDWKALFQKILPLIIKYLPEILPIFLDDKKE